MTIIDSAPVHHLELVPLGERAWRLCDQPADGDEETTLVAYVEELPGGIFEAVWVHPGPGVETFATREDVLVAAVRRLATVVSVNSKPIPIPHRAPLSYR